MEIVKDNNTVSVHYTGTLKNGEVFDTSREREPLSFKVGEGQMIPGFEKAVKGMKVSETKKVTLAPEDAYGEMVADMVQKVPKEQLPADLKVEKGQQLTSQLPDGQQIIVTVTEIEDEHITVDANHPLAGKELIFDIEVVSID